MRSVTEQGALDEFLATAELAGTDFTTERSNQFKIISADRSNPHLLSATEERAVVQKQRQNRQRLTVPRRPPWDADTTAQQLDEREREALLQWRRGLAELQEHDDLLMTPFERNLEVWRQLWRVIERSDVVVQIVDARNPLLFRCEDLEQYVKEVDPRKNNLLLVNKADMMTLDQRRAWADYFAGAGVNFRFFSAELAREVNDARQASDDGASADDHAEGDELDQGLGEDALAKEAEKLAIQERQEEDEQWVDEETIAGPGRDTRDEQTRILTTDELEALFLTHAPKVESHDGQASRKTTIGLVGYPNVGKSSTINALIGAKKVSVSATPGKTKHFQTIHLSDAVMLCDCPGLVFPNFATTKAELVCSGVLPIDQLREYTGPAALVAERIPAPFLEAVYGMKLAVRAADEGGTGVPTGLELLRAYAAARGFATAGQGQPDASRAARVVLKDYVKGKLLFCHAPPTDPPTDPHAFNRALYDVHHLPTKRRGPRLASLAEASASPPADASEAPSLLDAAGTGEAPAQGAKGARLDERFFARGQGTAHLRMPFHRAVADDPARQKLSGRKFRDMVALERDVDASELRLGDKKHWKANKRKARRGEGRGYD